MDPARPATLLDLFCQPARFFAPARQLARQPALFLAIWTTGMARVQDRFDVLLSRDPSVARADTLFLPLTESWLKTWVILLLAGVLAGGLGWLIGGWWYGMRLRLCGDREASPREARLAWAYVALVSSLPSVLLLVIDTFRYPSYYDSYQTPVDVLALLVAVVVLWSPWVSYRAATTRFKVSSGTARFWFLALPFVYQLTTLWFFGSLAALRAR